MTVARPRARFLSKESNYFGVKFGFDKKNDGDYDLKEKHQDTFSFTLTETAVGYDASKVHVKYYQSDDEQRLGVEGKDYHLDGLRTKESIEEIIKASSSALNEEQKSDAPSFHESTDSFTMTFLHAGTYHITFKKGTFIGANGQKSMESATLVVKVKSSDTHTASYEYTNFETPDYPEETQEATGSGGSISDLGHEDEGGITLSSASYSIEADYHL
jgi:5-hydroxyisourate hydrolase-like protein (transthyretin family)